MQRRAHILLKTDADGADTWTDERIAEALDTTRMTVSRVRPQFVAEGLDADATPQAADGSAVPQTRRAAGGQAHCDRLFIGPPRPVAVDDETAGRPAGRAGGGRIDRPGNGVPNA